MRNYKKIKAYNLADNLVEEIYKKTKNFPKEETYGIVSQIRRAAVSVPTNIVEGSSRKHQKEYLHFLYISRGSLSELEYLIRLSHKLQYLKIDTFEQLNDQIIETAKTLYGLIRYIEKS